MSKEQRQQKPRFSSGPAESAEPSLREWGRGFLLNQLVGTVFGPFIRLIAAVLLGAGGVFLVLAWQIAPQKAIDAARYAKYTQRVQGQIVESWLAVELNIADIRQPLNWRVSTRASPCAVVEYGGDWGGLMRRAYCGNRLSFSSEYTLHDLTEITTHVPFVWARDRSGFLTPEIRVDRTASAWLAAHGFDTFMHKKWPVKSALDELRIELDQPVDYAIAGWTAPARMMPLAINPQRPGEALPAGFIDAHRSWQPAMLIVSAIVGSLGLLIWFEGMTVLLGENVPVLARIFIAALPVLALPWWGDYFPRALSHLHAGFAFVIGDMLGDTERTDRLVASAPEDATLAGGERLIWLPSDGVYKQSFGRVRFALPASQAASADTALAWLADAVTVQTRSWDLDQRIALFEQLRDDKLLDLRAAGTAFLLAAKEAVLDPQSDPVLRRAATNFLIEWLTQPMSEPWTRDPAYRQKVRLLGALAEIPVPEISIMANSFAEPAQKKQ